MKNETIALLYIHHLIHPVEELLKNSKFKKQISKNEQLELEKFLLRQYQTIEKIIAENDK